MTDFLTRLIERTLNLAPTVQPVVRPMFAQGPAPAGPAGRDGSIPGTSEVANRQEPVDQERPAIPSQRNLLSKRFHQHEDSSPVSPVPPSHLVRNVGVNPAPLDQAETTFSEEVTFGPAQRGKGQHGETTNITPSGLRHSDGPLSPEHAVESATASSDSSVNSHRKKGEGRDLRGERSSHPERNVLDPPEGLVRVDPSNEIAGPKPLAAFSQREFQPPMVRPQSIRLSAEVSSPPAIRVTIGRIEVRAVMQQASIATA